MPAPSTLGTFLHSFSWAHARQLDAVAARLLGRAWAAGAGPGEAALTIDVDSTITEGYGSKKQGARYGYTKVRGYHPLVVATAGGGDVLGVRLRGGNSHTARGSASFLSEVFNRARAAGASGPFTLRADSGFYSKNVVDACKKAGSAYSITVTAADVSRKADRQGNIISMMSPVPCTAFTRRPRRNGRPASRSSTNRRTAVRNLCWSVLLNRRQS